VSGPAQPVDFDAIAYTKAREQSRALKQRIRAAVRAHTFTREHHECLSRMNGQL
jgi:hypothetical protein